MKTTGHQNNRGRRVPGDSMPALLLGGVLK
jgi:hypothetical protein